MSRCTPGPPQLTGRPVFWDRWQLCAKYITYPGRLCQDFERVGQDCLPFVALHLLLLARSNVPHHPRSPCIKSIPDCFLKGQWTHILNMQLGDLSGCPTQQVLTSQPHVLFTVRDSVVQNIKDIYPTYPCQSYLPPPLRIPHVIYFLLFFLLLIQEALRMLRILSRTLEMPV